MKNIILLISFFAFFACGNEKTKSNTTVEASIEKPTSSISPSGIAGTGLDKVMDIAANKNASEVQQELIDKAKMEKSASEKVEAVSSNISEAVKEKSTKVVEKVKEVAAVKNEIPKAAEKTTLEINNEKKFAEKALENKNLAEAAAQKKASEAARIRAEKEKELANSVRVEKPDFVDEKQPPPPPPAFSHAILDGLLRKHVSSSGKVNYKGLKSQESKLNAYLNQLEGTPIDKTWGKNKKMAYWINAYNAYTIKLILNNYPLSSITKLEGGKPWDKKWIKLDGRTLSLNNIENDILRPTYKDARIHFAVNCAAKSCPPLLNQAWTASNLTSNFEKQAKAFINNSKYNNISGNKAEVSKIFEWYAADFGDLKSFLNKYAKTPIGSGTEIKYMEYDWALNE